MNYASEIRGAWHRYRAAALVPGIALGLVAAGSHATATLAATNVAGAAVTGCPPRPVMAYVGPSPDTTPINTTTNKAGRPITVGPDGGPMAVTPDGKMLYVVNGGGWQAVTPVNT
jgi:DNA-binding beta-propeller fold protein YncE